MHFLNLNLNLNLLFLSFHGFASLSHIPVNGLGDITKQAMVFFTSRGSNDKDGVFFNCNE